MPFPDAKIYIAFNDGPYVASPTWTEVTSYVRSVTVSRGRVDDLEDFPAGTAQLVLDNRDRRFDPFYTTGPYYEKLTPRRQIKIIGRANSVDYDVFRGYIAGWPVEWTEAGYDSTVTIQCFDALGLMANEVVPTDWVYEYTKSLNPRHYWRCDDSRGSQTLSDDGAVPLTMSLNNAALPYFFEQPPLAPGFNGNSAAVTNYWTSSIANAPTMPLEITDFAFTGWLQFAGIYGSVSAIEMVYKRITLTIEYYVRVVGSTPIGTFQVYIFTPTATKYWTSTVSPNAMAPYFFAVNFDAATQTVAFKINDVTATGTLTTSGGSGSTSLDYMRFQGIIVQDIAVYERKLTATEQTALYNFGSGRILETTSARMARLRDTTDYPSALTSFTGSPVASVSEIGTGAGVIQELQLTADSEGGELYVSKAGVLTMTPRFGNFSGRSATSQATFTDSGTGLRYGPELLIEYDADSLKNDITVTYSGDGEVNVYNDANITEYGGAATTIETYLDTPAAASALATAKSGVYAALVPRISPIDVSVNTAAADWQTILGLELLDRVTFKRTPSVGNQFDRDALIQGIDHQIEPGVWRTQLTLSMRYTSPLIVGDSVRGRVDFNYCG